MWKQRLMLFGVLWALGQVALAANLARAGEKILCSLPSIAGVVEASLPAVVGIANSQAAFADLGPNRAQPSFFPPQEGPRLLEQKLIGSGVILKPEGLIVTNLHVLEEAEAVVVRLASGETFLGQVIGTDAKTDIALIKIVPPRPLPFLPLGSSEELQVGDWVVAIGSLPGLQQTVTLGIVSAKGRDIGIGPYDDYIQTDAALTLGLSGGPLLNLRGELVGINTAVASQDGVFLNVGFALPSDQLRYLVPQLEKFGKVTRGYLGIFMQEVTPELAALLGTGSLPGVLVTDVVAGSPAFQAGLKRGDVIVQYGDHPATSPRRLAHLIAQSPPGETVTLRILRRRQPLVLRAAVGEEPARKSEAVMVRAENEWGFEVTRRMPQGRQGFSFGELEVSAVTPAGPAALAGLQVGDRIVEVDHRLVKTLAELEQLLAERKEAMLVFVYREGRGRFLVLRRLGMAKALKPR